MRRLVPFAALFLLTCGPRKSTEPVPVIVISVDTLRSDHLPMYGYHRVETPALDAFRRDAVLFQHAYSHSPLTLPSHTTLLTGLLPGSHGVRDNTGFRVQPATQTLATILHGHGYATGGAVSAFVLRAATGISAGFDLYDDRVDRGAGEKSLGAVQRPGEATAEVARQWIAAYATRPFLFFLHLYEPHAPYDPPEPYRSRYPNRYDGEVATSDAIAGRFLEFLKQQGIYDRALIVILSDHGEGLGDHGEEEHGIFLYREAISVPMLIKLPGNKLAGETVANAAGLVDVTPTLLNILGIAAPPKLDGRPLLSATAVLENAPRPVYSETFYPRFHFGWSDLHSLIDGNDHLIDAPHPELYDLASDPVEKNNRIDADRRRYAALRNALVPFRREAAAPGGINREEAEKLAALGYIGSTVAASSANLPDPKDKVAVFRELQDAFRLFRQHDDTHALAAIDRLIAKEPGMVDLWDVRSKLLVRLGRPNEAIDATKEALRRNPSATNLAADLANQLLLAGRYDEAAKHAELALASEPARAHEILSRLALLRDDLATAEREGTLAVAAAPNDPNPALYTLAQVARKKGASGEVVRITGEILDRLKESGAPALPGLHALRGDALARTGHEPQAEQELREELRAHPADVSANRGLIVLLASQGRTIEATQAIRDFATAAPNPRTYAAIAETLKVLGDEEGARYWRGRVKGEE
jgi:arylsulfatase A-like enzyme/Tfp pilus assembly protein PilF